MSRWRRLLLVSFPLALVLTAAFRFIQHTDTEYSFWVRTFGETAALQEARCAAAGSPTVCSRARERRSLANEYQSYRDAVLAWWWPALLTMLLAWLAAVMAAVALAIAAWRRRRFGPDAPRGPAPG